MKAFSRIAMVAVALAATLGPGVAVAVPAADAASSEMAPTPMGTAAELAFSTATATPFGAAGAAAPGSAGLSFGTEMMTVAEPTSLVLLCAGVGGILLGRRRAPRGSEKDEG